MSRSVKRYMALGPMMEPDEIRIGGYVSASDYDELKAEIDTMRYQIETLQSDAKFHIGDRVRKTKGSQWSGVVVGTYSTVLTPEGYAVESSTETGSVQIYPAQALEVVV